MKSIKVFLYCYKNKKILNLLKDLIEKESKNNLITYFVYDQNNLDSSKKYDEMNNVVYKHIKWDNWFGKTHYRRSFLLSANNYYLEINDKIVLNKNWDEFLINNLKDGSIISGKNMLSLTNKDIFLEKKYTISESMSETNFVNFDLFFSKFNDAISLLSLCILKDYGQDLYASIIYNEKKIKIYSLPDSFYSINNAESENYKPYSIYHGYNNMIEKIKTINNTDFENFHNIKVSEIKKMPNQTDDVDFLKIKNNLDSLTDGRYVKSYSTIEIL